MDAIMEKQQQNDKFFNKKNVIILSTIVVLLFSTVAVAWLFQQQKIDSLTQQKSELAMSEDKTKKELALQKGSNIQLKNQVDELNKKLNNLQNPEQAKLTIAVSEAKHNGIIYNETGNDLVFIDITATNNSPTLGGYFYPSGLTLKDSQNNSVYPLCQNSPVGYYICQSGLNVPSGKTELVSQAIPATQAVRGVVGFYVPKDLKTAILTYDGVSFEVKMQN